MRTTRVLLIVACFSTLGFASRIAVADDTMRANRSPLEALVEVRDVHTGPDQVDGVLVNLSSKPVSSVRIRIDRSWLWADERHAGGTEDSPGRTAVYAVPGTIPPGGRLPFTYRSDTPLPQRTDGHFDTSVTVVGVEQAG